MSDNNRKKKTNIWDYGKRLAIDAGLGLVIGGLKGAGLGVVQGVAGNRLYEIITDPEVEKATRKRGEDDRRGQIERDRAMTDALMKDYTEREKRNAQANKERTARFQPPATPPGQDRDALRGRPKIVIPD